MPKRQARQWYKIVAPSASAKNGGVPTSAEVLIYDYIDPFGVSAEQFVNDVNALDVDQLDVRINSGGGAASDGVAIYNALKRHPAQVTTYNDGRALSAASFIAQAGDKRVTSKYAQTMVHSPWLAVVGSSADLIAAANQLDKMNSSMAQLYADAAGGDAKDWLAVMDAETWYTAEEAVQAGLFDEIDPAADEDEDASSAAGRQLAAAAASQFDYSMFRYAGREAAPNPFATATETKENPMAETKPDEAAAKPDEDTRPEKAEDKQPTASAPVTPTARVAPEGTVVVDAEVWRNMQEQARMGAEAHATLQAQASAKVVDGAIDKGKITPARRDHFMALMKADPVGTTTLLNETLAEAAIPLTELGHAAAKSDTDPVAQLDLDNPLFAGWKV